MSDGKEAATRISKLSSRNSMAPQRITGSLDLSAHRLRRRDLVCCREYSDIPKKAAILKLAQGPEEGNMKTLKRFGILSAVLAVALLIPAGTAEARHRRGGVNVWVGPGGVSVYGGYGGHHRPHYHYHSYYRPYYYGYGYSYPRYYYSYPSYGYHYSYPSYGGYYYSYPSYGYYDW